MVLPKGYVISSAGLGCYLFWTKLSVVTEHLRACFMFQKPSSSYTKYTIRQQMVDIRNLYGLGVIQISGTEKLDKPSVVYSLSLVGDIGILYVHLGLKYFG